MAPRPEYQDQLILTDTCFVGEGYGACYFTFLTYLLPTYPFPSMHYENATLRD